MPERNIDTVSGAKEEWLSSTIPALKELDAAILKVIESFSLAVKQSEELNFAIGAMGKTADETARKEAEAAAAAAAKIAEQYKENEKKISALNLGYERLGATKEELLAIDVREFEQQGATIEQAERYKKLLEDIKAAKEGISPSFAEFYRQNLTEAALQNKMYEESLQSLGAVQSSIYQGMEAQMLSFIETGRFSAAAFAKVVAQQVKTELVGLAAKSAVWAIYEVAMGLKDLAMGLPTAAVHFASAKQFALVGGAALAAAAGVQSLLGGIGGSNSASTTVGTAGRGQTAGALPAGLNTNLQVKPVQYVTIQIYNPLSTQNWAEIIEDNIIPALNDAADRNINIVVATA